MMTEQQILEATKDWGEKLLLTLNEITRNFK